MNIYRQVHALQLKILHEHNKTKRTELKNQLAELIPQLPEKEQEQEEETA